MSKRREPFRGAWINETLTDRALKVLHALPGYSPVLESRIGKLLGDYRFDREYRDSIEPTSERRDRLMDIANYAEKLSEAIKDLPSDLQQVICLRIDEATDGRGPTLLTDTARELDVLAFISRWGTKELHQASPDKRGRKSNRLEYKLLSDVAALLEELPGMGLVEAANQAREILLRCGIQTSRDNPRRTVREYRGGKLASRSG